MPPTIRLIFWLIALVSLVVAAVWYYNEPGFEPLLALLGVLPAIWEMMISPRSGNMSVKTIRSTDGAVTVAGKTGGDVNAEDVQAKSDVTITNE